MFRYCFLFLQEFDQKKSIFKVVNIILSIIHFLHDQIQACFTHDSPPLYCMACSLYLTFSHAQNGGRPPFSLLTSPSPCLSTPQPISLSPAPPPPSALLHDRSLTENDFHAATHLMGLTRL